MAAKFKIKGSLTKVLKQMAKDDMKMIKSSLRDSAKLVREKAREQSPVVTGTFRRSIRVRVKGKQSAGFAFAKIGVISDHKANYYAEDVEKKYNIFRTLEHTEDKQVRNTFISGLTKYWNKRKIKS